MIGVTVNESGALPEVGESKSQPDVVLTLQFRVPVPELAMETVRAAGLLPPWVAEKAMAVGLKLIAGPLLFNPYPLPLPFPGFAMA